MAELHTIKAQLYPNALTSNPNDFTARAVPEKSLSIADVCATAVKRGGADVSAASMEHAVNLFLKEMAYRLCDGFAVHTGWFNVLATIRGRFDSPTEKFNPEKHSIAFDFNQGTLLRKELENVVVDVLGVADSSLSVAQVIDIKSGSVNNRLTPGKNARITGNKLKIAGDSPDNGIRFYHVGGGPGISVNPSDIVVNNPSELLIVVPALASGGSYRLEIKTQYSGNNKTFLNSPRTYMFDMDLTAY